MNMSAQCNENTKTDTIHTHIEYTCGFGLQLQHMDGDGGLILCATKCPRGRH